MSFKLFDPSNDVINLKVDSSNAQFTISTSAVAASSAFWIFVANSTTAGYLFKPDTSSASASNVSSSGAFRNISNYLFGTTTYILDSYDKATQRTSIRCIQVGRPLLDEALYPGSITAVVNLVSDTAVVFTLSAYDVQNAGSVNSPLGLTGTMVNKADTNDIVGTVFYDHGIIVFHGGSGDTGTIMCSPASGFSLLGGNGTTASISALPTSSQLELISFKAQTKNIVKRSIFFCRAQNKEFNFTTNPTARDSEGFVLNSLTTNPTTWITTVGLYDGNGNLMAVGKINPPKRKDQYNEALIKVQLDF